MPPTGFFSESEQQNTLTGGKTMNFKTLIEISRNEVTEIEKKVKAASVPGKALARVVFEKQLIEARKLHHTLSALPTLAEDLSAFFFNPANGKKAVEILLGTFSNSTEEEKRNGR
jgi:hypothetical protein